MAIGTALALLGSAAISAGAGAYSASQQKKAAGQAQQAANEAADKQLAAQQAALDRVTELNKPFQQGGVVAENALLQRLGLTQPGTNIGGPDPYYGYRPQGAANGNAPATSGPPSQTPDWKAYLQANPDVLAWAQSGGGDPNIPIDQQSLEQRAAYQWANEQKVYGTEPRQLTYLSPQTAGDQQTPTSPERTDLMTADRPTTPEAPTYVRPDQGEAPSFGPAPDAGQYFGNFQADPGYQFALQQGLRSANAGYAARGLLKSDAAMKGLNDYAQGMAAQQYGNWWNRQNQLYQSALGQYNTDRSYGTNLFLANRANANQNYENDRSYGTNLWANQRDFANANFNADRAFQANRSDTLTGNLFSLAQMGQNAAAAVGGANQSYANNAGNIFGSQANAAADAANQRAAANAGMVGSIAGSVGNLFGSFGGGGGLPTQTIARGAPVFQAPIMPNGPLTTFNPPVF